jgi:hypothetical protein
MIPNIARLHIALAGTEPVIWRRVEVPLAATLAELHDVIQIVMPWDDCHLFQFEVAGAVYGVPDAEMDFAPDMSDAAAISLSDIVADGVKKFAYVYDFGDDWRHDITIELLVAAAPKAKYPRYVDGARAAPPEDVGGLPGFEQFVKTIVTGSVRAKRDMLDWLGGPYDPATVDGKQIEAELAEIARVVSR